MGMGDNSKASLITRGLAETARLGSALGADPATFMGLAGVGDLIATCMSHLSRNRTFGEMLGQGMSVAEVQAHTSQTAEGVKSCESIHQLARRPRRRHADRRRGRRRGPRRGDAASDGQGADDAVAEVRGRLSRTTAVAAASAWVRSRHRSSTSSMPTDIRNRLSGTVGDSAAYLRRRSMSDSTPPRLVASSQSRHAAATRVGGRRAPANLDRHHRAEPGVPDPLHRRMVRCAARELGGVGALPLEPDVQGAEPAQRQPRLHRTGDAAVDDAATQQGVVEVAGAG